MSLLFVYHAGVRVSMCRLFLCTHRCAHLVPALGAISHVFLVVCNEIDNCFYINSTKITLMHLKN